ncbi:MAG: prepilin-type N-terminal cleavage/methylation domain-containing protein [Acidobacteria bacterium]|nr:prepilin-type N-terminal cleavage/methylation domain-containing protein [Acidobacteriota bacterium]
MKRHARAGVTLIELLVAVTLFALLSVGMLYAFRIGIMAYQRTQTHLMDNRRVAGAQHILLEELQNMVPVTVACGGEGPPSVPFFQGEPEAMRLVSTYSLQGAARGMAQILEIFVAPADAGHGVRLLVNEIPYGGPMAAGRLCTAPGHYLPVTATEKSFVLADNLAYCKFSYQFVPLDLVPERVWLPRYPGKTWPRGVRIDMAPLVPNPASLQPISVVAVIRVHRNPEVQYGDF